MQAFSFETYEVDGNFIAVFKYIDKKISFFIDEKDLEDLIQKIFLSMPFDAIQETAKEFDEWEQQHWEAVWRTGLVNQKQVEEMAEGVWGKQTQEDFYAEF